MMCSAAEKAKSAFEEFCRAAAFVRRTKVCIDGVSAERLMVVLRSGGCTYSKTNGGCAMCSFERHSVPDWQGEKADEHLMSQLRGVLSDRQPVREQQLDLLTPGSFLDENEIPVRFRCRAFQYLSDFPTIRRVLVDSRIEYIDACDLGSVRHELREDQMLEIGVGVESGDDSIRNGILKKGLSWRELKKAVQQLASHGLGFVAYLLVGACSLTEREAFLDAISSARRVADLAAEVGLKSNQWRIAFEPVFVSPGTPLADQWRAGRYKPVNLWTVVSVLRKTKHLAGIFVGLSDEGLASKEGKPRGCDDCTDRVREAIEEFNGANDLSVFEGIECSNCLSSRSWVFER